jgi:hypothetical protein
MTSGFRPHEVGCAGQEAQMSRSAWMRESDKDLLGHMQEKQSFSGHQYLQKNVKIRFDVIYPLARQRRKEPSNI